MCLHGLLIEIKHNPCRTSIAKLHVNLLEFGTFNSYIFSLSHSSLSLSLVIAGGTLAKHRARGGPPLEAAPLPNEPPLKIQTQIFKVRENDNFKEDGKLRHRTEWADMMGAITVEVNK